MRLYCPYCGTLIPAEDMNLDRALAKCLSCDEVFSFADQFEGMSAASAPVSEPMVPPQPGRIRVEDWGGDLRLHWRWFSPKAVFILFFAIVWDGFLVFWYFMAFTQNGPLIMKLFPIIHVAVGFFVTYFAIASFLNTTEMRIGGGVLSIRHGPLPWPGPRDVQTSEIDQLFCKEHVSHSRNGTTVTFQLFAITKGGGRIKLISGADEAAHVRYIEHRLESELDIVNRRVTDELPV